MFVLMYVGVRVWCGGYSVKFHFHFYLHLHLCFTMVMFAERSLLLFVQQNLLSSLANENDSQL